MNATEIERLLIRIVGDNAQYITSLTQSTTATRNFQTAVNAAGKVTSTATGAASTAMTALKIAGVGMAGAVGGALAGLGTVVGGLALKSMAVEFLPVLKAASAAMDDLVHSVFEYVGLDGAIKATTDIFKGFSLLLKGDSDPLKLAPNADLEKFVHSMHDQSDLMQIRNEAEREVEQLRKSQLAKGVVLTQQELERATAAAKQVERTKQALALDEQRIQQARQLAEQQAQRTKDIETFIKSMQGDVDFFGMNTRQRQIESFYQQMREAGRPITDAEHQRIRGLDQELDRLQRIAKIEEDRTKAIAKQRQLHESMANEAMRLIESQLTPIERLKKEIDDIQRLAAAGALTQAQARQIANNKVAAFAKAQQGGNEPVYSAGTALMAGSKEALLAARGGHQSDSKSTERGVWRLLDKTELIVNKLDDIFYVLENRTNKPGSATVVPGDL
jgi:hypothetical protein